MSAIDKVLEEAKSTDSDMGKKADHAIRELFKSDIPGPDQVIQQGFIEEASRPTTPTSAPTAATAPKKPGRKPGKKAAASPRTDGMMPPEAIAAARTNMETNGYTRAEAITISRCRKRILKYFRGFPHKLVELFPDGPPMVQRMTFEELKKIEEIVTECINEIDESVYVKWAFRATAGFIEQHGAALSSRISFLPGVEVLAHQRGLAEVVNQAVDVPGDMGLQDDVLKLSIPWTGNSISHPVISIGTKLISIMQELEKHNLQQMRLNKPVEGSGL